MIGAMAARHIWLASLSIGCHQLFGLTPVAGPDADDVVDSRADGLVAWFQFDVSATVDTSGSGHDGSCAPCPPLAQGNFGMAAAFDGSEFVQLPSLGTGPFTVSAWVRLDQLLPNVVECVASKPFSADDRDSWQLCFRGQNGDTARPEFFTSDHNALVGDPISWLPLGTWRHVTITWDGANKSLYVAGAPPQTAKAMTEFDDSPIRLGDDNDFGAPTARLIGALDELRFYDHALGAAEINDL
jgi:hypothetical protein